MAIREQTKILAFPDRDTKLRLVTDAMLEQYRLNGNELGELGVNLSAATVSKISVDEDGESFDIGRHLRINDEWVKITDFTQGYSLTVTRAETPTTFTIGAEIGIVRSRNPLVSVAFGLTVGALSATATTFVVNVSKDGQALLQGPDVGPGTELSLVDNSGSEILVLTEVPVPSGQASVTVARGANGSTAAAHSNGDSIYDDNGPYTYVDMWSDEGLVYVHLKDANPV